MDLDFHSISSILNYLPSHKLYSFAVEINNKLLKRILLSKVYLKKFLYLGYINRRTKCLEIQCYPESKLHKKIIVDININEYVTKEISNYFIFYKTTNDNENCRINIIQIFPFKIKSIIIEQSLLSIKIKQINTYSFWLLITSIENGKLSDKIYLITKIKVVKVIQLSNYFSEISNIPLFLFLNDFLVTTHFGNNFYVIDFLSYINDDTKSLMKSEVKSFDYFNKNNKMNSANNNDDEKYIVPVYSDDNYRIKFVDNYYYISLSKEYLIIDNKNINKNDLGIKDNKKFKFPFYLNDLELEYSTIKDTKHNSENINIIYNKSIEHIIPEVSTNKYQKYLVRVKKANYKLSSKKENSNKELVVSNITILDEKLNYQSFNNYNSSYYSFSKKEGILTFYKENKELGRLVLDKTKNAFISKYNDEYLSLRAKQFIYLISFYECKICFSVDMQTRIKDLDYIGFINYPIDEYCLMSVWLYKF